MKNLNKSRTGSVFFLVPKRHLKGKMKTMIKSTYPCADNQKLTTLLNGGTLTSITKWVVITLTFLFLFTCYLYSGTVEEDVVTPYVEIRTSDGGKGSGGLVKVGDEELVLTAGHMVRDLRHVKDGKVTWNKGTIYKEIGKVKKEVQFEVVYYSAPPHDPDDNDDQDAVGGMDLALVRPLEKLNIPAAKLAFDLDLRPGREVWYCGSGSGTYQNLDRGILSRADAPSPYGESDPNTYLSISGDVWHGHSGSTVYVLEKDTYVVVGVVLGPIVFVNSPKVPARCANPKSIKAFVEGYLQRDKAYRAPAKTNP